MSEPNEIRLYGFGSYDELFDVSPFVAKLEAYLRLAEIDYQKRTGDPRKAPRGKLPYISHGGRFLGDSQRIIEYLRDQGLGDLDGWLDEDQRAELFALRSMLESDFYFVLVYSRWQDERGWAHYGRVIADIIRGAGAPGLLVPMITRSARKGALTQLRSQGTGRREPGENLAHARELFATLERSLARREQGPWWFGPKPSSADAVVHAFVSAAIVPKFGLELERVADPHPRLRAWFEQAHAHLRTPSS